MTSNRGAATPLPSMTELNPIGTGGSWELSVVLGLATWSYAMFSSLAGQTSTTHQGQVILAIVLLSFAVVLNMVASSPRTGRYRRYDFVLVVSFGLSASLLQGSASFGGLASLATGWGPLALAGILAAASSFRPQLDQLVAGLFAALLIAVQKTWEALQTGSPFGTVYFVVTAIAPIVIVTIGQSAYTGYAIRSLRSWRRGIEEGTDTSSHLPRVGAARKIGQDFIAEFARETRPLFTRILQSGRISEADSNQAAITAEHVRRRLVTISEQTWIERLPVTVVDPERIAGKFDVSARAAITALLSNLASSDVADIVVQLSRPGGADAIRLKVSGGHTQPRFYLRTQLSPLLRVLYVVFFDVTVGYETASVTVQFDYGVE
jgi:hypothetical protein